MFSQLGSWIASFLTGYVSNVVSELATGLAPIALLLLTVYIATYGFAIARGEASDSLQVFGWKMIKIAFILAFALSSANYMNVVFNTANGMQDGMSTIFINGSGGYGNSAPSTVWGALDASNDQANLLLKQLWGEASMWRLDLVIASIIFSLGTVIFMTVGAIVVVIAKMVMSFALAVGPLAILTLMFKQTAKFFDAWVSLLLSAVVLSWFVFFALGMSFYVVEQLIVTMTGSGAFTPAGAVNAVEAACTYLIFMLILAYLLYHAPQYASALTGGAAVQHGGQMLASYIGSRAGGQAGGAGAGAGGGGGGGVRAGGGFAYQSGRVAGAAATAAGQAVGQTANAAGRALSYAYQRVAARGARRH